MLSVGPAYIFVSPSASVPPLRLSDATVTFTCWHLAWGLLLWSRATAVCSHPLNFIYPNLRSSLETLLATGHRGQNQNTQTHTHIYSSLFVIYCCVYLPLKTACSAPFTHCSPLIHSFILLWACCWFWLCLSKLEVQDRNNSHYSVCQHLPFLNHQFSWLLVPQCLFFHTISILNRSEPALLIWLASSVY